MSVSSSAKLEAEQFVIENQNIPDEYFDPISEVDIEEEVTRKNKTFGQYAWRNFRKNPLAIIGLIVITLMVIFAIIGPHLVPYTYEQQDISNQYQRPNFQHWFGTDKFGRDVFVRVMYGARISLTIGFVVAIISLIIGVLYGGIAGFIGEQVDIVMMRICDIVSGVPSLCYVVLIMIYLNSSIFSIVLAICVTSWINTARVVRSQILSLKEQDFIMAARCIGESNKSILLKHLIPNSMGSIIISVTFIVPSAIFTEAFLSFLGIGIKVPMASWGTMVNDALPAYSSHPYLMFIPTIAIAITMFALNFIGDGLRDSLDSKFKK